MIRDQLPLVFTPEERDQNEARKGQLVELVASKEALLLVGAGSSALVGYDTWPKLLKKLERLACNCGSDFIVDERKRDGDPLEYAEDIQMHMKKTESLDKYYKLLYREFGPQYSPIDFHRTLVKLPFKGMLTFNYDKVLETALGISDNTLTIEEGAALRVSEFLLSLDFKKYPSRIAHIHGVYDKPSSIILSRADYIKFYGLAPSKGESESKLQNIVPSWSLHRKLLWAILATRRVVFVGFSMDDPYLSEILQLVSRDLWRWDESIHFAVMSISQETADETKIKAKRLKETYGVDVVFYEDFNNSHRGLKQIIAEIARECKVPRKSEWIETVDQRMEERMKTDGN